LTDAQIGQTYDATRQQYSEPEPRHDTSIHDYSLPPLNQDGTVLGYFDPLSSAHNQPAVSHIQHRKWNNMMGSHGAQGENALVFANSPEPRFAVPAVSSTDVTRLSAESKPACWAYDGVDDYMSSETSYTGYRFQVPLDHPWSVGMWVRLSRLGFSYPRSWPIFSLGDLALSGVSLRYYAFGGDPVANVYHSYYAAISSEGNYRFASVAKLWHGGPNNIYWNNPHGALGGRPTWCDGKPAPYHLPVFNTGPWFWHYVTMVNPLTSAIKLYVNGVLAGDVYPFGSNYNNSWNTWAPGVTADFHIGRELINGVSTYSPRMSCGHVIVHSKALTETEVRSCYDFTHKPITDRVYGHTFGAQNTYG
jgi:hypothetical protein